MRCSFRGRTLKLGCFERNIEKNGLQSICSDKTWNLYYYVDKINEIS